MTVDRNKPVTKEFGGRTYYFCGDHCMHAFETDFDKSRRDQPPRSTRRMPDH
jgi:YHS domain-containing protein